MIKPSNYYQKASIEDLREDFNKALLDCREKLKDSPISLSNTINRLIGTYEGICLARGLAGDFEPLKNAE